MNIFLNVQKLAGSKQTDAPPSARSNSSSFSEDTKQNKEKHNSSNNKGRRDRSLTPPPTKKRRSPTRSPLTSESSSRHPIEQADNTPDTKAEEENNKSLNNINKDKEKKQEWDMFADQDVDSNFDVSRWLVNFVQILTISIILKYKTFYKYRTSS